MARHTAGCSGPAVILARLGFVFAAMAKYLPAASW
jgi:hypothetical protein